MLGAIFQNFISLSIEGVRRSFFAQIEAAIKEIPHKKLILKKDRFEGMILVSRSTLKCQNSRLGVESQVKMPGTGQGALLNSLLRLDRCNMIILALKELSPFFLG